MSQKHVGVIAQSGGIGFALFNRGKAAGLGFSYVISTGNEADLTMADFLDYMVEDPHTDAVMLFCEAVAQRPPASSPPCRRRAIGGNPSLPSRSAGRMPAPEPALPTPLRCPGRTPAYHAVFERYGVIEAEDADEAVAVAGLALTCPLPKGRRTGIITVSGGGGAWMADTLSAHGLIVRPCRRKRNRPCVR